MKSGMDELVVLLAANGLDSRDRELMTLRPTQFSPLTSGDRCKRG
jgi:hypothetical protein